MMRSAKTDRRIALVALAIGLGLGYCIGLWAADYAQRRFTNHDNGQEEVERVCMRLARAARRDESNIEERIMMARYRQCVGVHQRPTTPEE